MHSRRRSASALAAGVVLVVGAGACTEPDGPDPDASPSPLPTAFTGEAPPGTGTEAVRHLHGPGADAPGILGEDGGVRITAIGESFLISSNSEERHLLQRASDGEVLWEGDHSVDAVLAPVEPGGAPAVRLSSGADDPATVVLDDQGEVLWEGGGARADYVQGLEVTRPDGWAPDEPYGVFSVADRQGEELWEFEFRAPDKADEPEADEPEGGGSEDGGGGEGSAGSGETGESDGGDDAAEIDADRMGVPVGAAPGAVFLVDGDGLFQARATGADGEDGLRDGDGGAEPGDLLWSYTGEDPDLLGGGAVPRPGPEIVGTYALPEQDADASATEPDGSEEPEASGSDAASPTGGGDDPSPSASGDDGAGDGGVAGPDTRDAVLLRWSLPEERSLLSMHDVATGDVRWTLAEPGANPADPEFAAETVAGTLFDPETATLLLPQASGQTPMIGVDIATGEERWSFRGEDERALAPAFAAGGYVYGDARGAEDTATSQVVLEAETKDVAADGLDSYVEAVSSDGYAVVVHQRQRFVMAPPDA